MTTLAPDVTFTSSIADAVRVVESKTGRRLDYLVNNSSAQYVMSNLGLGPGRGKEDVRCQRLVRHCHDLGFAPLLIASKGSVVNIASIAGYLHAPWMGTLFDPASTTLAKLMTAQACMVAPKPPSIILVRH